MTGVSIVDVNNKDLDVFIPSRALTDVQCTSHRCSAHYVRKESICCGDHLTKKYICP